MSNKIVLQFLDDLNQQLIGERRRMFWTDNALQDAAKRIVSAIEKTSDQQSLRHAVMHELAESDPGLRAVLAAVELLAAEFESSSSGSQGADLLQPISSREMEVLQLIVNCRTNQEIADILDISGDTVKRHISELLRKFEAQNRLGLAITAIELAIVRPNDFQRVPFARR